VQVITAKSPIRGDALLWRERNRGYFNDPYADLFWLYPAGFLFLMTIASGALSETSGANLVNAVFQISAGLAAAGSCLVLLLRLANCVSRERDSRTLESLLSLPVSRDRILYVKWLGAVLRSNRWAVALAVSLALGTVSGVFGWVQAILLLLLGFSWAALVSAIALCASVFTRTAVRSYIYSIVTIIGLATYVTLNAHFHLPQMGNQASFLGLLSDALSPFHACQLASQIRLGKDAFLKPILPLLSSALIYFAVAAAIAGIALWRFRREERYT
jgi:ABC-type transport system involved in multi-copper enzyme maturation permease subunit